METSAISAASTASVKSSSDGFDSMDSADFFKLLVTELKNQDPFSPSDTSDMISEVSQIRNIELSGELTDTLQQLSDRQRSLGSAELIGKYVEATTTSADGSEQTSAGVVTGIRFASDGNVVLELDTGTSVSATDVTFVSTLDQLEALARTELDASSTTDKSTAAARAKAAAQAKPNWFEELTGVRL
jgi:flagellar basal-body rod modification protein FlgD